MSSPDFVLADEIDALREGDYNVHNEVDLSAADAQAHAHLLDTLVDQLASSPASIENAPECYPTLLSFVKHYTCLAAAHRNKLVDALCSAYAAEIDVASRELEVEGPEAYKAHATLVEKYAFAVQWLITTAEKAAASRQERNAIAAAASAASANGGATSGGRGGRGGGRSAAAAAASANSLANYDWPRLIPSLLSVLHRSLRLSTGILFPLTPARDAFVSGCVLRPALLLQENEAYLKLAAVKLGVFKVVCAAVKAHGQAFAVQTSIMQALAYYEHLAEPMAELLTSLRVDFDHERLGEEVLREVAAREFGGLDSKSPRAFGRFLVRMAELNPRTVLRQIGLLVKHLDSESYPMRNAMLEILGMLIRELSSTDDALPSDSGSATRSGTGDDDADSGGAGGARGRDSSGNAASAAAGAGGNQGSADEQRGSAEARKKQVAHFWELICERFLDVNSYVRCKCISVCARLCELPTKFPAQRFVLAELAIQALSDKSSSARKNAIYLLSRLILTHPYGLMHGGDLDEVEWQKRLDEVDAQLAKYQEKLELPKDQAADEAEDPADEEEDEEVDEAELDEEQAAERRKRKLRARRSSAGGGALDVAALQASSSKVTAEDAQAVVRLRLLRRYYVDALRFIGQLGSAMPTLQQLLVSTSRAEVLEAMDFFRVAHEYRLPGAAVGVRKMVHLIWTKDNALVMEDGSQLKGVRSRLIEVYRTLYFEPLPELGARDNVNRIARNMIERTFGATLAELTSLEELFSTMCREGMVHDDVVNKLWAVYSAPRSIPRAQRRGAIIVLSMLAVSRREIVSHHIDKLLGIGLGSLGARDVVLAKYSCAALARVGGSVKKVKGSLSDEQQRFPMTHPMFAKLRAAIMWQPTTTPTTAAASAAATRAAGAADASASARGEWFSLAEHAVQTIYLLGEQPDALCTDVVKAMTLRAFGPRGPALSRESMGQAGEELPRTPQPRQSELPDVREEEEEEGEESEGGRGDAGDAVGGAEGEQQQGRADGEGEASKASAFALAQLLFVVGHVALKHIVYLELVEREYKRRKAESDKAKVLGRKDANADADKGKGRGGRAGAKKNGGRKEEESAVDAAAAAAAAADELDQVAGNAEDEIGDVVAEVREKELLYGQSSVLALFGPLAAHICKNAKTYNNDYLRKAAVSTLCKFMCVSSTYCEAHLPLLLSILANSSDPVVRSNVVIALGDIAVSFGNLVDENSDRLYAGLGDRDVSVKKHTLMVLTHLILNGMIKVKGQLGEMAKCLEDPEERVSDLAKLFFSELATKENAVYNNLPDIISHLSIGAHAVDEETFARTMRFIFTFIDKERQAENVVEKLCQRFRIASEERQWRDIAFCLSLLPYKSDRSVKRLIDGLPFYQDKLHDAVVFKRFSEIVAKARSNRGGPAGGQSAGGSSAAAQGLGGSAESSELAEFEQLLEGFKSQGVEDAAFEGAAQAKVAKARRERRKHGSAAFKPGGGGGGGAGAAPTSSGATASAVGNAAKPTKARVGGAATVAKRGATRRTAAAGRRRAAPRQSALDEADENDDDDDDF